MLKDEFQFVCLDPKRKKRKAVARTLSSLGAIRWKRLPPLSFRNYAETRERVDAAFRAATKKPVSNFAVFAKRSLLALQYNGSRAMFEQNPKAIGVAWNGLNGSRRVFMDGARDAGNKTLYFELSPFPGRITVDPSGVNYRNSLPREPDPYLAWVKSGGTASAWRKLGETITARKPAVPLDDGAARLPMDSPFLFIPLQVPGDSQLRIFGGEFRTVEAVVEAVAEAAKRLPIGWHARIKEHPSSPIRFGDLIDRIMHPKLVLDNSTDTFAQVRASKGVVTVNSSVGLEAMFFEKPVVALGDCFWAIPSIAEHCPSASGLVDLFTRPNEIAFDPAARVAFLSFLADQYYPRIGDAGDAAPLDLTEVEKVRARLHGRDALGFWSSQRDVNVTIGM